MYNPELGRYMQPDPIGVAGGMNLYSYVENNPLNASDPYGLRILRDSIGNWQFNSTNQLEKFPDGSIYEHGYFKTDKNTNINAMLYKGHDLFINKYNSDYASNCHGITFINGKYWINNDQVNLIIAEEFNEIPKEQAIASDIIIFSKNNNVTHSATILGNLFGSKWVKEKNGAYPGPWYWPLSWRDSNQTLKYYRAK